IDRRKENINKQQERVWHIDVSLNGRAKSLKSPISRDDKGGEPKGHEPQDTSKSLGRRRIKEEVRARSTFHASGSNRGSEQCQCVIVRFEFHPIFHADSDSGL